MIKFVFALACVSALLAAGHAADPFIPDDPLPGPVSPTPLPAPVPKTDALQDGGNQPKGANAPETSAPAKRSDAAVLKATPSGPAQPVVRSSAINVTATPTTKQSEAASKERSTQPARASLLDVKVKDTTVTISPSGVIRTRNPDIDLDAMKAAQMIAQFVQVIRKVIEAGQLQSAASAKKAKSHAVGGRGKVKVETVGEEAEAESEKAKAKAKEKAKEKEKKGKESDDEEESDEEEGEENESDGASEIQPTNVGDGDLVNNAKPFARKLPFRVRREAIRGQRSVGHVEFDGLTAPIVMNLQTIPQSHFASDSYRFTVAMEGAPLFAVELPKTFEEKTISGKASK